jgi:predicted peptidase
MVRILASALTAVVLLSSLVGCNGASEAARQAIGKDGDKGFNYAKLTRGNHTRKYGLFVPLAYDPAKKYPVIIFLQGVGEGNGVGEGDGKNLTVGLGPFVADRKSSFEFICIFPQSSGGWDPNSEYAEDVITALDDVSKKYSVDQDRVTLTGLSTGGYGTYAIAAKYPERFAAIVAMGSNGKAINEAGKLTKLSVRAYCSESGDIFAGSNDKDMVDKINELGGRAEFISTPTSGHNCWEYVYGSGDLFQWMSAQRRAAAPKTTSTPTTPAKAKG